MKADEVRLYALRGGLKKQSVCYTHFHSNKVFRGDLILYIQYLFHFRIYNSNGENYFQDNICQDINRQAHFLMHLPVVLTAAVIIVSDVL